MTQKKKIEAEAHINSQPTLLSAPVRSWQHNNIPLNLNRKLADANSDNLASYRVLSQTKSRTERFAGVNFVLQLIRQRSLVRGSCF